MFGIKVKQRNIAYTQKTSRPLSCLCCHSDTSVVSLRISRGGWWRGDKTTEPFEVSSPLICQRAVRRVEEQSLLIGCLDKEEEEEEDEKEESQSEEVRFSSRGFHWQYAPHQPDGCPPMTLL